MSVTVLCPNGHRQNVKVKPNTTLLKILEEVCSRQGFSSPEDYELRQGKTVLDLSVSIRFSNLPNNAKLELVKGAKARGETKVTMALQLENGSRFTDDFKPGMTLWELMEHIEKHPDSTAPLACTRTQGETKKHPVCIYMREEVSGEYALKNTTLKSLGLTGGKAIIRQIEEEALAEIQDDIDKEKLRMKQIETKRLKSQEQGAAVPPQSSSTARTDSPTHFEDEEMDVQSVPPLHEEPESGKSTEPPRKTKPIQSVPPLMEGVQIAPGVQMFRSGDAVQLSTDQQHMVSSMTSAIFGAPQSSNTTAPLRQPVPLSEFKFPEETRGKAVYKNELTEVNVKEFKPCDRQSTVYNVNEDTGVPMIGEEELPDEFFYVTETDVKKMMNDLQNSQEQSTGQQLVTKSMRQAMTEEKFSQYERAVIRVQFADGLVLQGVFRPRETVHALTKFVKEHLDHKSIPFYLYTAPPKRVLKDPALTLIRAQLVPLAVVHFGSEVHQDHYLPTDLLSHISTQIEANNVVISHLPEKRATESKVTTSGQQARTITAPPGAQAAAASTSSGATDNTNMPKWLKLGRNMTCNQYSAAACVDNII